MTSRLASLTLVVLALLVAGCGGGGGSDEGGSDGGGGGASGPIPGDAVAVVDGDAIKKADYDHWYAVFSKSPEGQALAAPDPPEYTECIRTRREALPEPAKGQPTTTDEQLKDQCEAQDNAIKEQAMQLLISVRWLEGEAEDQGVSVSEEEVRKEFDRQRQQSFPKDEDYQKFLEDSGQTEEDILLRVRLDLLSTRIRDKITKEDTQVSDQEIEDFYNKEKERYAQPERRDLLVVLTKTEAKADEARKRIESGDSWASVARQLSTDPASKAQGGKLAAVAKGEQERALDEAVFAAQKGELTGPIKTQFGYYVFRVQKVLPAEQQSLEQAKESIRAQLISQNQQKTLEDFVNGFEEKWRKVTNCRQGYRTSDCANGPKPTPVPSVPAVPGGAAPAPAPAAPQG